MGTGNYTPANLDSGPSTEIGLDVQHASPPTSAYVGKDDSLWIMCSNNGGATVTVNARFLMPSGEIKLNQWSIIFSLSRAAQFRQITLPECFLLSVAVVNNTINSATNISCYVAAIVSRSQPTSFNGAQVLCEGYSSGTMPISWPTGVNNNNVDGAGVSHVLVGTTPGAGAEISETVPSNAKWRVVSIFFSLVPSAAVANRSPFLVFDDGSNIFFRQYSTAVEPASTTYFYTWAVGLAGQLGGPSSFALQLPIDMFLWPGFRFRTINSNLQAGDQYTAPTYLVEEWLLP